VHAFLLYTLYAALPTYLESHSTSPARALVSA